MPAHANANAHAKPFACGLLEHARARVMRAFTILTFSLTECLFRPFFGTTCHQLLLRTGLLMSQRAPDEKYNYGYRRAYCVT